jgi:hypothetical protein
VTLARNALLLCALLTLAAPAGADTVKGDWFTDPDAALAAARDATKPVLAVAMDHG